MSHIVFLDAETTGLDPDRHEMCRWLRAHGQQNTCHYHLMDVGTHGGSG